MDDQPRSARKARLRKMVYLICTFLLLTPIGFYAVLLAMEAYSARQASAALTQLENLKLGDPASLYDHAVSAFKEEAGAHVLTAGAFRFERLWDWLWLFNQQWGDESFYFAYSARLRWWRITTTASTQDGKLTHISVGFMVVGRYEMLGTGWNLAHDHPFVSGRKPLTDLDRRTLLHWNAITSMPSGEGFQIEVTPQSTTKELAARRINRRCLLSFRGCDGLCELLPNTLAVLRERGTDWQGYTSVPASPCSPE
jgi:hypothetical protein